MLENINAMATVAVRDLARAQAFYEGTLGLEMVESNPGVATYRSGDTTVVIYESSYAGTNRATSVTWGVGDALDDRPEAGRGRRGVRALRRPARAASAGGRSCGRRVQGGLVPGSGR